ncbi:MAG: methyltransferase domain-containing protein, partial [Myxococcales bacterium]|nr:methyltransferase domain-containing protein [Myxococcales bacterium]
MDLERHVAARYGAAAREREPALCCPTSYDPALLAALPAEVIERDYGCGDPSRHVLPGERVLDLGSGTGKVCFLAAQRVGDAGHVIGVDASDEMLAVARRAAPQVAARVGYGNVEFRKGRIQDLRLDRDALEAWLRAHPVTGADDLDRLEAQVRTLRAEAPLIADASVDVALSNCVLNLVVPEDKATLFAELHRVLRPGGRAVISDIVSDEDIPTTLQRDPELWSGCVSGALREDRMLAAFEAAGFQGVELVERAARPWRVVDGIELRSVTVIAYRPERRACLDQGHAVIYRGPFRQVEDDDGHVLRRGVWTAVCERTFSAYARAPYRAHVHLLTPPSPPPLEVAPPFPCDGETRVRSAAEFKGSVDAPLAPP